MNKFVETKNKESADKLSALGMKLICANGDKYVFVNNSTIVFDRIEDLKYTNVLTF